MLRKSKVAATRVDRLLEEGDGGAHVPPTPSTDNLGLLPANCSALHVAAVKNRTGAFHTADNPLGNIDKSLGKEDGHDVGGDPSVCVAVGSFPEGGPSGAGGHDRMTLYIIIEHN